MTDPAGDSTYSPFASGFTTIRFGKTKTRTFGNFYYKEPYTINGYRDISITFNYVFTLRDSYVLDYNIYFITNEGLKIKVMFLRKGKWVKDTI